MAIRLLAFSAAQLRMSLDPAQPRERPFPRRVAHFQRAVAAEPSRNQELTAIEVLLSAGLVEEVTADPKVAAGVFCADGKE
jgi:hypothetical protein